MVLVEERREEPNRKAEHNKAEKQTGEEPDERRKTEKTSRSEEMSSSLLKKRRDEGAGGKENGLMAIMCASWRFVYKGKCDFRKCVGQRSEIKLNPVGSRGAEITEAYHCTAPQLLLVYGTAALHAQL